MTDTYFDKIFFKTSKFVVAAAKTTIFTSLSVYI